MDFIIRYLVKIVQSLETSHPGLYKWIKKIGKKYFSSLVISYPRVLGNEIQEVTRILKTPNWNMTCGSAHELLEEEFAEYIGVKYAVATNTGGMAIQMVLRTLGVKAGDEVIHQVDTCSADSFAVMNAGGTPVFSDISPDTWMLSEEDLRRNITERTKVIIPIHVWGNIEDMDMVRRIAKEQSLFVLEDSCLALGAEVGGKMAGSFGDASVFSFGCIKPIQAGEGGMIATNDEGFAKELRCLRHWGDRTIEFGIRDVTNLPYNGRMSEILAVVVREQLKGYPSFLQMLRESVLTFVNFMKKFEGIEVMGIGKDRSPAFNQVVLRLDEKRLGISKQELMDFLAHEGIFTWHANFELLPTLSFFKCNIWKDWILKGDIERVSQNYHREYPNAQWVFESAGLGLGKENFLSTNKLKYLCEKMETFLARKRG